MDVKVKIEGKNLVVTMPMQEPAPSASGKTLVVASTRGAMRTDAKVDGKPLLLNMTAYIKP
jgi:hypothetical protein